MTVVVNGHEQELDESTTISSVLQTMHLDGRRGVAVARNGDVVLRAEWPTTQLAAGDRIEVLHAVQGG